jgi:hypothetical protein
VAFSAAVGVGPGSRCFVGVLLKEMRQGIVPVQKEEKASESVANALVVARIQPEHVLQVLYGLFTTASGPRGVRQTEPGTHVGPGFKKTPEVADITLEGSRPQ